MKIFKLVFSYLIKFKPRHKHAKWPPSDLTPWTLTLKTGYFPGEETGDQVERELAELLLQFHKLFPTYVGSTNAQLKPKTYLFGESYGGAYVVSLGTFILANDKYKQVSCHLTLIGMTFEWKKNAHL